MNSIIYNTIYSNLLKLTQKVIGVISQKPIPEVYVYIPINQNISISNPGEIFRGISANQLIDWPELQPLIDEVNKNEDLKSIFFINTAERVKDNPIENKYWIARVFSIFIGNYLDEIIFKENLWDESKFLELYKRFELSLLQKKRTLIALVPFYYFDFDEETQSNEIPLGEGLSFVNPNIIDRKYFSPTGFALNQHYTTCKYFLRFLIQKDVNAGIEETDYENISRLVVGLLLSIRITVGGDAKFDEVIFTHQRGEFSRIEGITIRGRGYTPGGKKSIISRDNIKDILYYKEGLKNIEEDFSIALSRYAWVPDRVMKIDKLIDLTISLESLLSTTSDKTEMNFKIATRGAWLLGDGFEKRKDWYNKLKEIYDFRSKIVHGKSLSLKTEEQKKLDDVINDAQRAVEEIFKIIIRNSKLHKREQWDEFLKDVVYNTPQKLA